MSAIMATPPAQAAEPTSSQSVESWYDHVQCLIDGLPDDLTSSQREAAVTFIKDRSSISRSKFDIGCTRIIPDCIDTGDNKPHFEQLRHHPIA